MRRSERQDRIPRKEALVSLAITKPPFLGSWRLVSFALRREDGEVTQPFGPDAQGSLIYADSGCFSFQIHRTDRPHIAAGDQMKSSEEETVLNYRGYVAYHGRYLWNSGEGTVTHRVVGSLFPNWEGRDQKRFVRIVGGRLEMETPPTQWGGGEIVVAATVWQREGE
jgi:hypothetical protein